MQEASFFLILHYYLQIRKKRSNAPKYSQAFLDAVISMNAVADVGVRTGAQGSSPVLSFFQRSCCSIYYSGESESYGGGDQKVSVL